MFCYNMWNWKKHVDFYNRLYILLRFFCSAESTKINFCIKLHATTREMN